MNQRSETADLAARIEAAARRNGTDPGDLPAIHQASVEDQFWRITINKLDRRVDAEADLSADMDMLEDLAEGWRAYFD